MVYAGKVGAIPAALMAVITYLVVFNTAIVNLRQDLRASGDRLFSMQLGGGAT